jgi:hypothetical protein
MAKVHGTAKANGHTIRATIEIEIDGEPYPIDRLVDEAGISSRKLRRVLFEGREYELDNVW